MLCSMEVFLPCADCVRLTTHWLKAEFGEAFIAMQCRARQYCLTWVTRLRQPENSSLTMLLNIGRSS